MAATKVATRQQTMSVSGFKPPIGHFVSPLLTALALGTLTGAANRMDIYPWLCVEDMTVDQIGVEVTTAVASAQGKLVIYNVDADNRPTTLAFESTVLDFSTVGYKFVTQSFSFVKGTVYWFGIRHSSTAAVRAVAVGAMQSLGLTTGAATTANTIARRTVTFGNAAPNPWTFVASELANSAGALFKMRVA